MKLVELNRNPDEKQLKQFGLLCLALLPLAGWLFTSQSHLPRWLLGLLVLNPGPLVWDWGNVPLVVGLAAAGGVLAALGLTRPRLLRPIFVGACLVAMPIGMVVGELLLALIFFGLFTPIALVFRVMGRDALQMRLDRSASTYWQAKRRPTDVKSYFRQS